MIKFLLSVFMLILMPMRLLFVLSILLNIAFFLAITSFVKNDNYFNYKQEIKIIEQKIEKILESSCNFGIKCGIKVYGRHQDALQMVFEKNLNAEKPKKQSLTESIKAPIKRMIFEAETKIAMTKNPAKSCFKEGASITCSSPEIVAVFTAEKCEKCLEKFSFEFKDLEKRKYRTIPIKLTHEVMDFIHSLFPKEAKKEEQKEAEPKTPIKEKAVKKLSEIIESL